MNDENLPNGVKLASVTHAQRALYLVRDLEETRRVNGGSMTSAEGVTWLRAMALRSKRYDNRCGHVHIGQHGVWCFFHDRSSIRLDDDGCMVLGPST